ncbi:hypothetical protein HPB51_019972 [Rhipicephalus microplus]|uniref:MPN domain-containing protein n=1 Tax=Rhipicephalus microplus TaxID=6941 RepID=A0A9J6DC66_RHIMP|nr:hypothetical protein HPB51_019972 [Rhipicephalus microplus]
MDADDLSPSATLASKRECPSPAALASPGTESKYKVVVKPLSKVVVHPLVLLSVVDHFNRMGKVGHQDRVVGILLGSWKEKGVLDVSNSFAVPFDEDERDKTVWFLDHDYLENMYSMFKKVNGKSLVVAV